jgi:hypothetical protein
MNDERENTRSLTGLSVAAVEERVNALAPDAAGEEEIVNWLNLTEVLLQRAREIRHRMEQVAVEWIQLHGPLAVGDIRYSVGCPKTVRCLDVARCLRLVLAGCGGDVDGVAAYLRADPWKYGSVRSLLGESEFEQAFRSEWKPKLVEGRPQRQLQQTNTRFLPHKNPAAEE